MNFPFSGSWAERFPQWGVRNWPSALKTSARPDYNLFESYWPRMSVQTCIRCRSGWELPLGSISSLTLRLLVFMCGDLHWSFLLCILQSFFSFRRELFPACFWSWCRPRSGLPTWMRLSSPNMPTNTVSHLCCVGLPSSSPLVSKFLYLHFKNNITGCSGDFRSGFSSCLICGWDRQEEQEGGTVGGRWTLIMQPNEEVACFFVNVENSRVASDGTWGFVRQDKQMHERGKSWVPPPCWKSFLSAVMKATVWGGRDSVVKAEGVRLWAYSLVVARRKRRGRGL